MATRFRRRVRIAPGVRVNLGKTGVSLSAGPRGASVTKGRQGLHGNIGLTGSGLSYRTKLDGKGTAVNSRRVEAEQRRIARARAKLEAQQHRQEALTDISLKLRENGSIEVTDAFGDEVRGGNLKLLWEQHGSTVRSWLEDQLDKINGDVSLLEKIHEDSPYPDSLPIYEAFEFETPAPVPPQKPDTPERPKQTKLPKLNILLGMFKGKRMAHAAKQRELDDLHSQALKDWGERLAKIEATYSEDTRRYVEEQKRWENEKADHEAEEHRISSNFNDLIMRDVQVMERVFDRAISQLDWPRETLVSYEIKDGGETVWLDVDLPEIEDLPQQIAAVSSTGRKLNIKKKPVRKLRDEYAKHIHGIIFRLTCVVFATLPKSSHIYISGYSQRLDPSTGRINDDYLAAFKIDRENFLRINFDHLEMVSPIEALGAFEHRRKMSSTGIFKPITPYESLEA